MNLAISTLVMATLFFAGMAQSKSMDPHNGFAVAGICGAAAMVLAIIRFSKRKSAGE